ncbi:MAG TPA: DUF4337 domain-containing protein [Allosphingosinicella sp.]|jgi:hypothetical protein
MKSNDAAELIAEIHEERAESHAADSFRNRAALMIAIMAAVLAIGDLGGGNATDDMIGSNIKASDTWAFYQAKNVRQNLYKLAAEELETDLASGVLPAGHRTSAEERLKDYRATIARYDSEPDAEAPNDPLKGEGKKQLSARAKSFEAAFEEASARDNNFDLAEVALQLALVLGSVAILAINRWILILSATLGVIGTILTINGFVLAFTLP